MQQIPRLVLGDPKGLNHVLTNGKTYQRNQGDRTALELFVSPFASILINLYWPNSSDAASSLKKVKYLIPAPHINSPRLRRDSQENAQVFERTVHVRLIAYASFLLNMTRSVQAVQQVSNVFYDLAHRVRVKPVSLAVYDFLSTGR